MSNNKDTKKPEDLKYPAPAHIRTPHRPDIPVDYPDVRRQQQKQEPENKASSLDWLKEADHYEPPAPPKEADHYDPPKGDSKGNGKNIDLIDLYVAALRMMAFVLSLLLSLFIGFDLLQI
ncbi:hypothetical protein F5Y10DRAFT_264461 [Nemania abortiva]|nr:hypothetical protein F5Y10DRAFT_264461 [Nemania abortiva]